MKPGGIFTWADVFCEPGGSLTGYADRYAERIKHSWSILDLEQRMHMGPINGSSTSQRNSNSLKMPQDHRLHWERAWQGQHQAEAVAILKPT
jgi:hypothetical protein